MRRTLSLKEARDFQKTLRLGKWYGGNLISTYVIANNSEFNYLGLAIGKKVGKATKRNRVKRIIREAYLTVEKEIKVGYTIVFVWRAKAKFEDLSFEAIKLDIEKAFEKAGLIK